MFALLNIAALIIGINILLNDPLFKGMMTYLSVFRTVSTHYVDPVKPSDLFESSIKNVEDGLDPFTGYIPPRSYQYYEEESQGEFSGIGVEITVRDGLLTVISPIPGSPAADAGLQAGDQISMIGDVDASTLDPSEAIDLIRGAPGTEVDLKIRRPGLNEDFSVKLKRASVKLNSVDYAGVVDSIGYIRLTNFALNSLNEMLQAMEYVKSRGMKGLVLDLRGNPGGFLEIAVGITGLFLPKDVLIVSTGGKSFRENFRIKNFMDGMYQGFPMVVLVNGGSASASEIFSGALQDYDRAVIMGDTTFGKGLVQNITSLPDGGAFRLTVSRYYLPSGRIIQKFSDKGWSKNLVKTEAKPDSIYHTHDGRVVHGGGGVVPDILNTDEIPDMLEAQLIYGGYYFDFGVDYLKRNRDQFSLPFQRDIIDSFRTYLESIGFKTPNEIETSFEALLSGANEVDSGLVDPAVKNDIQNKIRAYENEVWTKDEPVILENLSLTLARLAYDNNDLYEKYYLHFDPSIKRAMELLKDKERYAEILSPKGD